MARRKRSTGDDPRWTWEVPPAPGELRVVHAFVKTAEGREGLSSPGALSRWLALWELMPAAELGTAELEKAIAVRRALRALVAANSGAALDEAEVERLDQALSGVSFRLRFRGAAARYELATDGFDGVLARLACLVERTRESPWRRLKMCREESCGRVYYDFSRTICGKWCTPRCGNRRSALSYRQRYKRVHGQTPGGMQRRK